MKIVLIIVLVALPRILLAQLPSFDAIVMDICDSLKTHETELDKLSKEQTIGIIRKSIFDNHAEWTKAYADFSKLGNGDQFEFKSYFEHISQLSCPQYRRIDHHIDPYLEDRAQLRPQYLRTKEFVGAVEDNLGYQYTSKFISDSLLGLKTQVLLANMEQLMDECERTSVMNIMMLYREGNTYSVKYNDLTTTRTLLQIDVNYGDMVDLLIDGIILKGRDTLELERLKLIEIKNKSQLSKKQFPPQPQAPDPR